MALARLPVGERVLDRLGDLLYDADDILSILKADDATSVRWMEPMIERIYEDVNSLMKRIAD